MISLSPPAVEESVVISYGILTANVITILKSTSKYEKNNTLHHHPVMKQCLMIDGMEIEYTVETENIFAVLGSVYIYRPVTFLDTLRIVYLGLSRNCGYTYDEFQTAVMKGQIRASRRKKHYPLSVASLRIRNRVKQINKQFLQSKNSR